MKLVHPVLSVICRFFTQSFPEKQVYELHIKQLYLQLFHFLIFEPSRSVSPLK